MKYPKSISHWIDNKEVLSKSGYFIKKINPTNGEFLANVTSGERVDVEKAVRVAFEAFDNWSQTTVLKRAELLRKATLLIQKKKEEIAQIVHLETGKSVKDAIGEVEGAVELGFFMAGEGRRFYGKTTTSAIDNRWAYTVRQPVGVCALIVPFNTPFANVSWKTFPSILCGNTCVLKAASDTPYTPIWFARILKEAGLPSGVFNVIQGKGEEVGVFLVKNRKINLVSFTGSTQTGKLIQEKTAGRFVKVSLEMGGKNAFVVCDDADLMKAVDFVLLSAFSNAGQRCASASRIVVFENIYESFKKLLLERTNRLRIGSGDSDDLGPVINEKQMKNILISVENAVKSGAKLLAGGFKLTTGKYKKGFFIAPTILENVSVEDEISKTELFGPVTCLYKVKSLEEAINLTNDSPYGLTAAIHTNNIYRVFKFINLVRVGVVSVNGPTYGSEPHLPFGGLKNSGNGYREPGTEALDVYSEWKTVYIRHDTDKD